MRTAGGIGGSALSSPSSSSSSPSSPSPASSPSSSKITAALARAHMALSTHSLMNISGASHDTRSNQKSLPLCCGGRSMAGRGTHPRNHVLVRVCVYFGASTTATLQPYTYAPLSWFTRLYGHHMMMVCGSGRCGEHVRRHVGSIYTFFIKLIHFALDPQLKTLFAHTRATHHHGRWSLFSLLHCY